MRDVLKNAPLWIREWMALHKIALWGAADLREFKTPCDETGLGFPFAVSWAVPMNPHIMHSIRSGPNQAYADEYAKVNHHINELSVGLETEMKARGFRSLALAASKRTDPVNIKGDFPQKTAATRAGLGWIGRHCQLITRSFGPWIRLGTVFTDLELPCGPSMARNFCGDCTRCLDACPAKALKGGKWYPGMPRKAILDASGCDQWKKEHYYSYHKGHNCGICTAVCPYGSKSLRKQNRR